MNKVLIAFLSLVILINPNISYSSNYYNYKNVGNGYLFQGQDTCINRLKELQSRAEEIDDLDLDTSYIEKTIKKLKEALMSNDRFYLEDESELLRDEIIPMLKFSLQKAKQVNNQEKSEILSELIEICEKVAVELEKL